jgi:hypothetical protein
VWTDRRIFLAAAAAILILQLIAPPVVGLANTGDFGKVYGVFGMGTPHERHFGFIDARLEFSSRFRFWQHIYSSEILLVPPAIALNSVFHKDGSFDLRFIGVVHGALFLATLALFAPLLSDASRAVRIGIMALVLWIFCDVLYVANLNSFYMDVSAYLFLLLSAAAFLRLLRWHRRTDAALLSVCSLMLVTSKSQHSILGFWLAAVFFAARAALWPKAPKVFAGMAALLAAASLLWLWKSAPPENALGNVYDVVFYRVLPNARNVDRALAELGLDSSWRPYIGKHQYSPGSRMDDPKFVHAFGRKTSMGRLAFYFLTHPRDAYVAMRQSLDRAGRRRPWLGNFDPSAGLPAFAESRSFCFWSDWNRSWFQHRGSRFFDCFIGLAAAASALLAAQRRRLPAGALAGGFALVGMAFSELAVSSLADALDEPRHHFLFFTLVDMLVILTVWLAIREVARLAARRAP